MPLRLRTSTVRAKGRAYQYFQLVRAVRRDGRPTHEVVAHLGRLPTHEVEALRRGLRSLSAEGAEPSEGQEGTEPLVRLREIACLGALRYLDLMVVRSMWTEWNLTQFFAEHLPAGAGDMAPADVVFALVANRCVAPCSKLRVTEWTPSTALPEIIGFEPGQLNNTRLHRVLRKLENIDVELSRFIIAHPTRRTRPDSVVYLDLTSTWFEGHGGTLGQRARSKDGAIRRHVVQLALGVDRHGLPLQWEVLPGKAAEVDIIPKWIQSLDKHSELKGLPLVFDRGITSEENLGLLIKSGRTFVTCARESQVERWNLGVDIQALSQLPTDPVPTSEELVKLELKPTEDEDIFHLDQGVRTAVGLEAIGGGLRVVPYFRPSLFVRNRESLERVSQNVEGKIQTMNDELRCAKGDRSEESLRKKIDELLRTFGVTGEFSVCLEEHVVAGARRPIRSFQVRLTRTSTPSARRLNSGWMMLLAHPADERPALDLIRQYHQKEVVEHAFGIIKSFVDLRPIHHHTDQKIRAHVTICILALLLGRALELKLREAGLKDAIDRLYEALEPCRLQVLGHGRDVRYALTAVRPQQTRLLQALGVPHLAEQEATHSLRPRTTPFAS